MVDYHTLIGYHQHFDKIFVIRSLRSDGTFSTAVGSPDPPSTFKILADIIEIINIIE